MDEAIAVLRAAADRAHEGEQTGPDVRLALRVLRFVGVPPADLNYFWNSCSADNSIGRSQSMRAALNRIDLVLAGKI